MTHSPTPTELLALRTANAALLSSPDAFCDIAATIVFALGSAQLLQSPETAMELELLQRELAAARAELEGLRALKPAPIQTCQTCGAGYKLGQPCGQCEFTARMAAEAPSPDPLAYGPTGIRCGCGKDAHSNLLPCRPDSPEDPHTSPLHHDYALGHDLPARADLPESLR